jgi:hypothetical protein
MGSAYIRTIRFFLNADPTLLNISAYLPSGTAGILFRLTQDLRLYRYPEARALFKT